MNDKIIKEKVKEKYSKVLVKKCGCGSSCCENTDCSIETAERIGYSAEDIKNIPHESFHGLGCGNPVALADLKEGERVLDLGSGAGVDVFLAANRVGKSGFVIGVDMTGEMVSKAKENAEKYGYKNVEFRLGEIEHLPVDDNSMDVIISNCVINLSTDKLKTFREAFRVLKPGGRMMVSDLVTEGLVTEKAKKNFELWTGCIAGALEKKDYIGKIKKAGFKDIKIVSEKTWEEDKIKVAVTSIKVKAVKYAVQGRRNA